MHLPTVIGVCLVMLVGVGVNAERFVHPVDPKRPVYSKTRQRNRLSPLPLEMRRWYHKQYHVISPVPDSVRTVIRDPKPHHPPPGPLAHRSFYLETYDAPHHIHTGNRSHTHCADGFSWPAPVFGKQKEDGRTSQWIVDVDSSGSRLDPGKVMKALRHADHIWRSAVAEKYADHAFPPHTHYHSLVTKRDPSLPDYGNRVTFDELKSGVLARRLVKVVVSFNRPSHNDQRVEIVGCSIVLSNSNEIYWTVDEHPLESAGYPARDGAFDLTNALMWAHGICLGFHPVNHPEHTMFPGAAPGETHKTSLACGDRDAAQQYASKHA